MIGILIVAHGSLADSLVECATHVLGQRPRGLATLDFIGHADPDERQKAEFLYAGVNNNFWREPAAVSNS